MISSCFCFLGGFFPAGDLVVLVVVVVEVVEVVEVVVEVAAVIVKLLNITHVPSHYGEQLR